MLASTLFSVALLSTIESVPQIHVQNPNSGLGLARAASSRRSPRLLSGLQLPGGTAVIRDSLHVLSARPYRRDGLALPPPQQDDFRPVRTKRATLTRRALQAPARGSDQQSRHRSLRKDRKQKQVFCPLQSEEERMGGFFLSVSSCLRDLPVRLRTRK